MARNAKAVKAPANNNSDMVAPQLDPAPYPARVVQMVFLGVQPQSPYKGEEKKPVDEVRITYELSTEFMQDKEGNVLEDKPRWFSETIPFYSLNSDRAKSTKRYNAIDPKDESDGDFQGLLTRGCQVVLVNNPGRGKHEGKIFTNIGDVTPAVNLPGYEQPELINPTTYFDPQDENCDVEVFNSLPEFLQETIKKATDYPSSPLCAKLGGAPAPKEEAADEGDKEDIY